MAGTDLVLRRVEAREYDRVGAITVAAYAPFTRGPHDPYVSRLADTAARDRDAEVWVAVDGTGDGEGALLGSVTLCPPGSPWRELATAGEGEFRMLSVDPAAQGRGAGAALVRLCLERARGAGEAAVVISSLREMAAAHRLYGRLGFERVPARDWEPVPGVRLLGFRLDLEE
jgi:ribosomal protein S18 acetylase RimI-like enzyme